MEQRQVLEKKLNDSFNVFQENLKGLRTGRASPNLLDPLVVNAYGSKMPLNQVATVSVQGPTTLAIQVWDQGLVPSVEKSIQESSLGLNPQVAGTTLRITLPDLTEERRKELTKQLTKYAEETRVAMRAVRRLGMDALKKAEKDKTMSEDEAHQEGAVIQKLLDKAIEQVEKRLKEKEAELMKI
ncbi:MAG: ribosome recycling factor [Holosporaceae bacterium]